jgi:hypothetical protein
MPRCDRTVAGRVRMHIGGWQQKVVVAALLVGAAGMAAAGDEGPKDGGGVALALHAGLATGDSATGFTLGGSVLYDVASRLSVEATGSYLDRGHGESGASGLASLLVNLRPVGEKVVPYLAVGGGVYYSSFDGPFRPDLGEGMGFGPRSGGRRGMERWLDPTGACAADASHDGCVLSGDTAGHGSSTDGALTVGGGIRIDLGHGLFLRPDARAIVIFGDDTRTLGALTVGLGYRF